MYLRRTLLLFILIIVLLFSTSCGLLFPCSEAGLFSTTRKFDNEFNLYSGFSTIRLNAGETIELRPETNMFRYQEFRGDERCAESGEKDGIYKADFVLDIKDPSIFTAEQFEDLNGTPKYQDFSYELKIRVTGLEVGESDLLLKIILPYLKDSKTGADTALVNIPIVVSAAG